jgi:hypothetical protein
MSVDVGMDVHRQRSRSPSWMRPAPQRNRDLPHDPAKLTLVLGTLPPGTPVAFEAAYG